MKKAILKVLFKPLTLINKIMKKDKNLIFFYSNLGFRDNVKAFYDYLIKNKYNEKYHIVVSINDYEDYVNNSPENVEFVNNKQGIKAFMRAKYAFYCFGKYPIKPSKKQTVINLWHGTPLKRVGNMEQGCEKIDYNFFTKVMTTAPMYKPIMAQIFGCKESHVEVMGNPRNDEMFVSDKLVDTAVRMGSNKVIVWLPTYREYDQEFVVASLSIEDLKALDEYLKGVNCRMIIKLHPLQEADVAGLKFKYIDIITQEQLNKQRMSVYSLLRNADGLITDYSSVYFDFMLLDRPIAFAVGDIEQYGAKRGFVFDNPKEYMPGMEIENLYDVEKFVADVFNGMDPYKEKRHEINDKVNFYKDGESSKRIAERYIR